MGIKISALPAGSPEQSAVVPATTTLGNTCKVRISDIANLATKYSVGLGNVDNTSDLDKPISDAVQAALDGKLNKIRRGSEQVLLEVDPVLAAGDFGLDTTNNVMKVGNGQDPWSALPVLAMANPVILPRESAFASKMTIRSPIVDFKSVADTVVFQVPDGYVFSIDSFEVLTTDITNPADPPSIRFGNSSDLSAYRDPEETTSNAPGSRHIIENPQDAAVAGVIVTFGVTSESSADSHFGCGVVSGNLIRIS